MPTEGDQTQHPEGEGEEQGGQPQTTQASREQFEALQAKLSKVEKEAKIHQARADRLQARADRQRLQRRPTPVQRTQPQQTQTQRQPEQDDLAEFASEQAKEAMLYRELLRRGLTEEDVAGIEFESPVELRMQLESIQQQKEITQLRAELEARKVSLEEGGQQEEGGVGGSREVQVDVGGLSGVVAVSDEQLQEAENLRAQARELRNKGRLKEARWVALRAAQKDPTKRLLVREDEQ